MKGIELIDFVKSKGFDIFDDQTFPYNLNIIGHRKHQSRVNYFDDELTVLWKFKDIWYDQCWPITTLPGLPSLLKPVNPDGTAILAAGQYKQSYLPGLHRGKYEALIQVRPVTVYRDMNLDCEFNMDPRSQETGLFGINIHKAGFFEQFVGPNSAGCQVFQVAEHFKQFMAICNLSAQIWGKMFTYTLIEY